MPNGLRKSDPYKIWDEMLHTPRRANDPDLSQPYGAARAVSPWADTTGAVRRYTERPYRETGLPGMATDMLLGGTARYADKLARGEQMDTMDYFMPALELPGGVAGAVTRGITKTGAGLRQGYSTAVNAAPDMGRREALSNIGKGGVAAASLAAAPMMTMKALTKEAAESVPKAAGKIVTPDDVFRPSAFIREAPSTDVLGRLPPTLQPDSKLDDLGRAIDDARHDIEFGSPGDYSPMDWDESVSRLDKATKEADAFSRTPEGMKAWDEATPGTSELRNNMVREIKKLKNEQNKGFYNPDEKKFIDELAPDGNNFDEVAKKYDFEYSPQEWADDTSDVYIKGNSSEPLLGKLAELNQNIYRKKAYQQLGKQSDITKRNMTNEDAFTKDFEKAFKRDELSREQYRQMGETPNPFWGGTRLNNKSYGISEARAEELMEQIKKQRRGLR